MILQNIVRANSPGIKMVAKKLLAFYTHAVLVGVNSMLFPLTGGHCDRQCSL